MKHNRLTISIDKPAKDLFEYLIDPQHSPKWMDFVVTEQAGEWPPKLGTIYRDMDRDLGEWLEYKVTAYEPDSAFELSQDWGFHVRYTLTPRGADTTELELHEWVDDGDLSETTPPQVLEKLKQLVEAA